MENSDPEHQENLSFQDVMLELGRDLAFDGVPIRCARCGKREMISGLLRAGVTGYHTGYVCEECEPNDD